MSKPAEDAPRECVIWDAIHAELYGRSGFDDWWDGIDRDIRREIRHAIVQIIKEKLAQ
jgi:hypothetical protein